jgi:dethiobiotin synthetase
MGGAAPDRTQARRPRLTNPLSPALSRQGPEPLRLVVCGTDTDVGKTVVSALLVQGLGASYWKPVQCGLEAAVIGTGSASGCSCRNRGCCQRPIALPPGLPHWAAELEGTASGASPAPIDPGRLALPAVAGPLVVECAGGLLVPLRRDRLQIEQIRAWGLPVVLVCRTGLGTLNHTLLSLEALAQRQIGVLGLVLDGPARRQPQDPGRPGGRPGAGLPPPWRPSTARAWPSRWQGSGLAQSLAAARRRPGPPGGAQPGRERWACCRPGPIPGRQPGPDPQIN